MTESKKKEITAVIISLFTVLITLKSMGDNISRDTDKLGGGFGEATPQANQQFVCNIDELECIRRVSEDYRADINNHRLLILGNSQLGAINQVKAGDKSYAKILIEDPTLKKYLSRSIWMPNASLKEFHAVYQTLTECGSQPDFLVIPVFLDDTRENDIRESVGTLKDSLCSISKQYERSKIVNAKDHDKEDLSQTLSDYIVSNLPVFSDMPTVNANLRANIYRLRNTIFGISANSKRRIIPTSYKSNMMSLEHLIIKRNSLGQRTLLYVPPLLYSTTRPSMIPYFAAEYRLIKKDIDSLCFKPHCRVVNLEGLVPDYDWGLKASTNLRSDQEPDFMHFTGRGHQKLARKLRNEFISHF